MRLTTRGKVVATILTALTGLVIALLLRDTCWVGNGYGSCQELWHTYEKKGALTPP